MSITGPERVLNLDEFELVVTFSEPVTIQGTFLVENGELISLTGSDPVTLTIKPNGDGDIQLTIPVGVVGNFTANATNEAPEMHTVYFGPPPPLTIMSFTGPEGERVLTLDEFDVVVTFSEPVGLIGTSRNFDFDVTNGEVIRVTGDRTATLTVTIEPNGDGDILISAPLGRFSDVTSSMFNIASGVYTVFFGPAPITNTDPFPLSGIAGPPSVGTLEVFHVTWTFSEVVTLDRSDFEVTNGSLTGFEATNGSSTGTSLSSKASLSSTTNLSSKVFRLTITPDGSGALLSTHSLRDVLQTATTSSTHA
ncbi:MAG: hypothetical protein ACNYPI_10725 [Arenicellales bacterium WSBS_2016_MAG_OTU3]